MSKFKEGQIVYFLESKLAKELGLVGEQGVIESYRDDGSYDYRVSFTTENGDTDYTIVYEKEISDQPPKSEPEVEYRDGYKVIYSDPATIVIFPDGLRGVAKALPGDKYDKEIGREIALRKAEIKENLRRIKELKRQIKRLGNQSN